MTLGDLEREVMEVFWADPSRSLTVREVVPDFPNHAYTTIMTVLSRLAAKGFLVEGKVGRLNSFCAAAPREDYITSLILEALSGTQDRKAVLARFAESMPPSDRKYFSRIFNRRSEK